MAKLKDDVAEVIRAKRFEIVDSGGRVRVRIGPDPSRAGHRGEDYYNIEMFAPDGERCAFIRSWPEGGAMAELGRPPIGSVHLEGGSGSPFSNHGASFIMHGGAGLGSQYGIWIREGGFPSIHNSGPAVEFGARPESRSAMIACLPAVKRYIERCDGDAGSRKRGEATSARRHVREFCAEFDVEVPEWATDGAARRARKVTAAK